MRNPDRIKPFLNRLEQTWREVPEWRFGQLMSNLFRGLKDKDPFYYEDDMLLKELEKFDKDVLGL